jgi:hypothetical protein
MQAGEPVTFEFVRAAGPAAGRKQAYDPGQDRYFLQVRDIARFKVTAVAPGLERRQVVLVITGMLDQPEGPLELQVDGKTYRLDHEGHAAELFRIQRKDQVTTIEFLPKGKQLLKPGAVFQYIDYYRG